MTEPNTAIPAVPVEAPYGNQQRIYQVIKARIVNCEMPPGESIYEDRIATEFGTSRTPVREALLKLRNDNLVSIIPRKGTFVSYLTVKDVHEIYAIRQLIEPGIAVKVRETVDSERIEAFALSFEELQSDATQRAEWFQLDREFHTYLVHCSANRTLNEIYEGIMNQQQRISILAGRLPSRLQDTAIEHRKIVDALLERNGSRIERAVAAHIMAAWEASLRIEQLIR